VTRDANGGQVRFDSRVSADRSLREPHAA
jgi:hypothetical protein